MYYFFPNIHMSSRSSLENHTRFLTEIGKPYTPAFSDRNGTKPVLFWGTAYTYMDYREE